MQVSLPFGFSPAASQKLAHPDGELATSRAAAKFGICMGLSSYSNHSLEDVGAQGLGNPYVIQMCVLRDRSITLQLLKRAESMSSRTTLVPANIPRIRIQGPIPISRCASSGDAPERDAKQLLPARRHGVAEHSQQRERWLRQD